MHSNLSRILCSLVIPQSAFGFKTNYTNPIPSIHGPTTTKARTVSWCSLRWCSLRKLAHLRSRPRRRKQSGLLYQSTRNLPGFQDLRNLMLRKVDYLLVNVWLLISEPVVAVSVREMVWCSLRVGWRQSVLLCVTNYRPSGFNNVILRILHGCKYRRPLWKTVVTPWRYPSLALSHRYRLRHDHLQGVSQLWASNASVFRHSRPVMYLCLMSQR